MGSSLTSRDGRFIRTLADRLGPRFHNVCGDAARDFGTAGVRRPGGEQKVSMYVVHHSAGSSQQTWRDIARYHTKSLGWSTFGYNATVDAQGHLWLMAPPSRMTYGAGPKWNPITVHLCALGNYQQASPPAPMLEAIWQWLCTCDDVLGYQPWRPHRAIRQTACPGEKLAPHVWEMAKLGAANPRPARYT